MVEKHSDVEREQKQREGARAQRERESAQREGESAQREGESAQQGTARARAAVPVIDLGPLSGCGLAPQQAHASVERRLARQLVEALSTVGFAALSNHGISGASLSALQESAQRFFSLPSSEKAQISMAHRGRAWRGYFSEGAELTSGLADQKEGIYFGVDHAPAHPSVLKGFPMHGENLWPAQSSTLRPLVEEHMRAAQALGEQLLGLIGLGLGLGRGYFAGRFQGAEPTCLFRIFNYPAHPEERARESERWGVGPHTDMGLLTLLFQDASGGLELQRRDGSWVEAPAQPERCLINIGDMLERWTWGRLRATLHRVKSPESAPRLSFPFFYDPPWEATLEPIDEARFLPRGGDPSLPASSPEAGSWGSAGAAERWDGLPLHELEDTITYGDFVWEKIRTVFPSLAGENSS